MENFMSKMRRLVKSKTDIITNSSTEVYTYVTKESADNLVEIIDSILSAAGSTFKAKDLVEIKPTCSKKADVDYYYEDYVKNDVEEGETPLSKEEWLAKENESCLESFECPLTLYDSFKVKALRPEAEKIVKAITEILPKIYRSEEFLC